MSRTLKPSPGNHFAGVSKIVDATAEIAGLIS